MLAFQAQASEGFELVLMRKQATKLKKIIILIDINYLKKSYKKK